MPEKLTFLIKISNLLENEFGRFNISFSAIRQKYSFQRDERKYDNIEQKQHSNTMFILVKEAVCPFEILRIFDRPVACWEELGCR